MKTFSAETKRILAEHRVGSPLFSNMIAAEIFEARYTRGPLKVLPRADSGFIAYDERKPVGSRTVSGPHRTADEALKAIEAMRDREAAKEAR